ncbi:hypothetical protein L3Q82_013686 [Scortum barcoo]|uniref:Uncharacterized protein n=1 Tax=Scortum barcoo TaxID=214431 RepID=A0ACB8W257_9TELE|nr:hypothetical protein L3Q82_013686 [Scortum barcoo]
MPDPASSSTAGLLFRADRNQQSGKARGGGLCVYVNKDLCTNCTLVNSHCSEAIEHMTVKCRPHYLPPCHHTDMGNIHWTCWTVFIPTPTNKTHTEPSPTPHLGFSDHISIMLLPCCIVPAYRPLLRHTPMQRTITVWPSDAVPALQDCFQRTDWQTFREAAAVREGEVDLEDYTSAVLGYISKCTEDVTSTRTVTEYPNQKPWLNAGGPVSAESQGCCVQVTGGPHLLKTRCLIIPIRQNDHPSPVPTVQQDHTVTGLNDYRPVALTPTPVVMKCMKCFEPTSRLVMAHIKDCIDVTVDPHQYAYRKNRKNRSTEDAISSVVHTALTHLENLENKDSYVRLLFVDFTSAFNTIIPQTLVQKLTTLGLSLTLCNWVLDFLTDRPPCSL